MHPGQWVALTRAVTAGTTPLKKGTVGIYHPLDGARLYWKEDARILGVEGEGLVGFHAIDPVKGFETTYEVMLPPSWIEPLTDPEKIPAARRATFHGDWHLPPAESSTRPVWIWGLLAVSLLFGLALLLWWSLS